MLRARFSGRDGREAEGAPLLREYGVYSSIEGSNPSLSAISIRMGFLPIRMEIGDSEDLVRTLVRLNCREQFRTSAFFADGP